MDEDNRLAVSPIGKGETHAVGGFDEIRRPRPCQKRGGMRVHGVIGHARQQAGADRV